MKYSKLQLDIWRAREKLDRELAGMTAAEIQDYANSVLHRFKAKTGIELRPGAGKQRPPRPVSSP